MSSFIIKKTIKNVNKIEKISVDGYSFVPKKTNITSITIKQVTIANPKLIDTILMTKFDKMFKKIAKSVVYVIADDDTDETDVLIALDEIARLRAIILNKYQKFLTKEKEKYCLQKIRMLENELRNKMVYLTRNYEHIEERKIGRSR